MAELRLRGLLLSLAISWFVAGLTRGISRIFVNSYLSLGYHRLAVSDLYFGLFESRFLVLVAISSLSVVVLTLLARALSANRFPGKSVAFMTVWSIFLLFWLPVAINEIAALSAYRKVISARLFLSLPQLAVLLVACLAAVCSAYLTFVFSKSTRRSALVATGGAVVAMSTVIFLAGPSPDFGSARPESAPNVVLITIDTLRADHLRTYGYRRETSPNIDRLAATGIRYDLAISQAPNTHPSVASLLTSAYPTQMEGPLKYIPYGFATVAEAMRDAGYNTAAVVSNVWLKKDRGFDQGFQSFDQTSAMSEFYQDQDRSGWKDASAVSDAGVRWLENRPEGPFFLWLHFLDPHHPYEPAEKSSKILPETNTEQPPFVDELRRLPTKDQGRLLKEMARDPDISDADYSALLDLYDDEIAFTDEQIGAVVEKLKDLDLFDNTLIAVTADHGEEFRDHGDWGHNHSLYNELIHVPLILVLPGGLEEGRAIGETVSLIDLGPTILSLIGLQIPQTMQGIPLPLFGGADAVRPRPTASLLGRTKSAAIQIGGWKMIYEPQDHIVQLFHLIEDPLESNDLSNSEPERVGMMLRTLNETLGSGYLDWVHQTGKSRTENDLDQETRRELEALGYLD